jgi:protein-disulfide isomerase
VTETHRGRELSQAALAAVARNRRKRRRQLVFMGVIVLVVLAALAVGGTMISNAARDETEGKVIAVHDDAGLRQEYAGTRDGVTVVSGSPDARLTLDIYSDFLCPLCAAFHEAEAAAITRHVNAGDLLVRHHMVPLLTDASDPPGYSLDAANAALCAADEGEFVPFHDSLFAQQPREGSRGYDKGQLTDLGRRIGITGPAFAECVRSGAYDGELRSEFARTAGDPALRQEGADSFGTPTVVANGRVVDVGERDWLADLLRR